MKANLSQSSSRKQLWERYKRSGEWPANMPVPLLARIMNMSRIFKAHLEDEFGMNPACLRILFEASEPGGVSQAAIRKNYGIDPAAVSRTVQVMERDGIVTRQPSVQDSRLMQIFLTDKGQVLVEKLPQRLAQFEQELVEGWTDEEISQLHALLEKLENRLSLMNKEINQKGTL